MSLQNHSEYPFNGNTTLWGCDAMLPNQVKCCSFSPTPTVAAYHRQICEVGNEKSFKESWMGMEWIVGRPVADVKRGNCSEFFHAYVKYLSSFYNFNLNRISFTAGMRSSEMES